MLIDLLLRSESTESFLRALTPLLTTRLLGERAEIPAAVTLLRARCPALHAASGPAARALDETGERFPEGPATTALRQQTMVRVGDARIDHRWPDYLAAAADHGILSVLVLPFELGDDAQGVLTLFSTRAHDFGPEMIESTGQPVRQASKVLRLAVRLARYRALEQDLRTALSTRTTIDLAVGILMAQNRCGQDEAVALLRRASQHRNVLLREVASEVVESFSRSPPRVHFDS